MPVREAYRERITPEVQIRTYANFDRLQSGLYAPPQDHIPPYKILDPLEPSINLTTEADAEYGGWFAYLSHWIAQLPRLGRFDLRVASHSDNDHHGSEDTGIVIGETIKEALGNKAGIIRNGYSLYPFEGNRCDLSLDLSGRGDFTIEGDLIEDSKLYQMVYHWFRSVALNGGIDIYVVLRAGREKRNDHHKAESMFKALARALDGATKIHPFENPNQLTVPSTKETLGGS